ncbi:hypothetical protein [Reichenbachiella sp.]
MQNISIWGSWWMPIRKWFYPIWLLYEISYRFYEYSWAVHTYLSNAQDQITCYLGGLGAQILTISCSMVTFSICTAFLSVPACFVLYKFFSTQNLTGTELELKMKIWF